MSEFWATIGRAAHEEGRPRIPGGDPAVQQAITNLAVGQGAAEIMRAWGQGWDSANLKECVCVFSCAEDPATRCSLSGQWHVHPDDGTGVFGPCPAHPDAPGDL